MKRKYTAVVWLISAETAAQPALRLDPENPHYFFFHGRPTALVTSGEHYGAVINRAFDYIPYLDELKRNHLNLTRLWVVRCWPRVCSPWVRRRAGAGTFSSAPPARHH